MKILWNPTEDCAGGCCSLEVEDGFKNVSKVIRVCDRHEPMRDGKTDEEFFQALLTEVRISNAARIAAKVVP